MYLFARKTAALLLTPLFLVACGGGGSSGGTGSSSFTGKFVDATVSGMAYRCGSSSTTSGLTTAIGEYTCPTGQAVSFYVGDIFMGSVSTPMAVITPLDLVGANASPSNTTVMNIVRFLMSISSTNPTTGTITIDPAVATAAVGKSADFSLSTTTSLDALIGVIKPGATVFTPSDATTHMTSTIHGLFAGNYAGTYSGDDSGAWSIAIDTNGAVSGTSDNGVITGSMATTLSTASTYGFTGTAGGVPWTGTLNVSTKVFSGTWNDGAGNTGTFTGNVSTSTPVPVVGLPLITSYTPTSTTAGTVLTLTGTDLTSVTQVLFTGPSPSFDFVAGVISSQSASSITTAVPSTLAAGSYTVSVVYPNGEAAAATALTVSSTGGSGTGTGNGNGAGLSFSPAFNGASTIANATPIVTGSIFLYSQNSFQQQFSVTYTPASGSVPEGLTIQATSVANSTPQTAIVNQITTANNMSPSCTLTAHTLLPTCSNAGIVFNKTAGTISFTNTPMAINIGDTTPQPTAFTLNGTLTFPPF